MCVADWPYGLFVSIDFRPTVTLSGHLGSPPAFSRVRVTRSLVLCVCFVDRCLFLWPLCCSIYGFWLPLWYLQTHLESLYHNDDSYPLQQITALLQFVLDKMILMFSPITDFVCLLHWDSYPHSPWGYNCTQLRLVACWKCVKFFIIIWCYCVLFQMRCMLHLSIHFFFLP